MIAPRNTYDWRQPSRFRMRSFHAPKGWRRAKALMPSFRLGDRVPDLGAAVGTLIDEIDFRQAPMGLDVSHMHRQQSYAAWADNRSGLDFVMPDVGWHVGSPSQQSVNFNPALT